MIIRLGYGNGGLVSHGGDSLVHLYSEGLCRRNELCSHSTLLKDEIWGRWLSESDSLSLRAKGDSLSKLPFT